MRKNTRWWIIPATIALLFTSITGANALQIKAQHVKMIPGTSQTIRTCYYDYNWFEEMVLGYRDGPRSGNACR